MVHAGEHAGEWDKTSSRGARQRRWPGKGGGPAQSFREARPSQTRIDPAPLAEEPGGRSGES
jgi:hypothetical protein